MAGEGPPFLTVGTAVSAKYRGAFCEAKVKVVKKLVKCKINFKSGTNSVVNDEFIKGTLKVGSLVEAKQTENGLYEEGTIMKLTDASLYTVVFDDGDEKTLRRTLLCLQGEKHFHESETLDHLPLTDPENFGTPVVNTKKMRRKRRTSNRSHRSEDDEEEEEDEEDSDSDSSPKKQPKDEPEDAVGKVVIVEMNEKRKNSSFPALVVDPSCTKDVQTRGKDQIVVRSFKDNKFYTVSKSSRKPFLSKDHVYKGDVSSLKTATEKAVTFIDTGQLPSNWDMDMLRKKGKQGSTEATEDTSEDSSDDEYDMEKDAWLASLHKFMEERGTPINKPPVLGFRDLNLYKLYKLVQDQGGCRKVTDRQVWAHIMTKMGIPVSASPQTYNIHTAYNKYLFAFEEFNRKMGPAPRIFTRTRRRSFDRGWITPPTFKQRSPAKQEAKDEASDAEEEEEDVSPSKKRVTRKKGEDSGKQAEPEESKRETREAKARAKEQEKEEKDTSDREDKKGTRKSAKDPKSKDKPKEDSAAKEKVTDEKESEGKDKPKTDAKGKDRSKEEKGKEKVKEEKTREKAKEDKVKEKPKEDKTKEKVKEEKGKEKPKEEKGKDKPKDDKGKSTDTTSKEKGGGAKGKDKKGKSKGSSKDDGKDDAPEIDAGFDVGERVLVQYGRGRTEKIYEAKVVDIELKGKDHVFTVHYTGWNNRYDEAVKKNRIVGSAEKKKKKVTPKGKSDKEKSKKELERREKEEQERKEKEEAERKEREEKEKQARLQKELKEKQEKERLQKEKAEKERQEKERLEREMKEKERKERLEKERLEKERKEKQDRDRKEKQEKERKEKLERERREKLEKDLKEKQEREKEEKLEKERLERERKEKLEKEKKEKQEKDKRDKLELEKKEKERQEQEKREKELAEKAKEAEKEKEKTGKETKRTPNSKRGRPSVGSKGSPIQQQASPKVSSSSSGRGKATSPAPIFSQRSMRSDRKSLTESPFAGGLNVQSRPKRLSRGSEFRRETQDESESEVDEGDAQSESQQSTQESEDLSVKDSALQEEEVNEDSDTSKNEEHASTLTKIKDEKPNFDEDVDDGPPTLTAQVGPEASEDVVADENSEAPKVEEVGKVSEEKDAGKSKGKKESKIRLRKSLERSRDGSKDSRRDSTSEVFTEDRVVSKDEPEDDSDKQEEKEKMDDTPVLERQVPVETEVKEKLEELKQESKDSASDVEKPNEKKKGRKKGRRSVDSRKRSKADTDTEAQVKQEDPDLSEPKKKYAKVERRKSEKDGKKITEQDAKTENADSDFGSSSVEDKSLPGTSKSFMTTPPTTPESSPKMPSSPSQEEDVHIKMEEQSSTKSDSDALIEVASVDEREPPKAESVPTPAMNSSFPNNVQKKECTKSESHHTSPKKRRRGLSESDQGKKRRKHSRRRRSSVSERRHSTKEHGNNNSSDTDESRSESRLTASLSKHQLSMRNHAGNLPPGRVADGTTPQGQRQPRWNFLVDLSNVKDPEERIAIIQRQLTELRNVYLQLKQEVASIDRRRKKFRKKEREAAQTMAGVAMGHCISHTSEKVDTGGS
ncbi:uncharacterized protein [Diadema setosum]|uniref:uncharacterized protein isoform X1 n=1 Tax=Diadema setosum TaxID=31175 RepID=UPI003B3AB27B